MFVSSNALVLLHFSVIRNENTGKLKRRVEMLCTISLAERLNIGDSKLCSIGASGSH